MIDLAFSTNAFKRYSLEDSIKEITKVGYRGVEILCDIPHAYPPHLKEEDQIRSLKKTLSSYNTAISNLNAFTLFAIGDTYYPSWIDDSSSRREMRILHTIECIRLAKRIGAKHLSTEPGGPVTLPSSSSSSSLSSSVSSSSSSSQQKQQLQDINHLEEIFLDGLKKVAKIAEKEDIKVLIEPEPGLLIENSRQFKKLMTKVINAEYIKLNFDIGHFYCVNEDPAKVVLELSDYIEHFHLADIAHTRVHNHLIPGRGSIDFRSVFDAMDDIGYRGFVTVELYPYQDNPIEAAEEAYDYLCNIM